MPPGTQAAVRLRHRRSSLPRLRFPLLFSTGCALLLSACAASPPAPAPKTGQTTCYGTTGAGIIDCPGTGQDGDASSGISWPDPRFTLSGERILADRLTGLAWSRDADPAGGAMTWRQALDYVKALNRRKYLGHDDWRVPNLNEMRSLVNRQASPADWLVSSGFLNVPRDDFWTATSYAPLPDHAWRVGLYSGIAAAGPKKGGGFLWPVRGGTRGPAPIPATGQADCRDESGKSVDCAGTGQDGETRSGAAWPAPRFADDGDRTLTDRLTGLVWTRDGRAPGPPACAPGTRKSGQGALDYIACLNANRYLGRTDWRLPNINELASLSNRGQANNAEWLNRQGFTNVQPGPYWSSSTYASTPWNAWGITMQDGAEGSFSRKHDLDAWPVRSGR
jgi:uncharacterized membrane protein